MLKFSNPPKNEVTKLVLDRVERRIQGQGSFLPKVLIEDRKRQQFNQEVAVAALDCLAINAQLDFLQTEALQLLAAGERAALEYVGAFACNTKMSASEAKIDHFRSQSEDISHKLTAFFSFARSMVSGLNDQSGDEFSGYSDAAPQTTTQAGNQDVLARLRSLTARQKRVVELLMTGLPNKVIAYELGIAETTVKAHVGVILQKMNVCSRARVIVLLANIDMSSISELPTKS
jgi:DNA-binding NarL/FixJ family response regulator